MKKFLPIFIIVLLVLIMTGRYLTHGAPHEFLTVEYKGTFEGDYDFTLELVNSIKKYQALPLWSQIYSGPIFVFAANLHVVGQALLYFLTHNQALSVKIYQVIYFMLAGIGMYLLANYIYKRRFIAVFCSILYMFTPYFMGEMLSYLHYSATYFCLPLAYFFIFKALDSREYIFYSLISALIITFNLLSHPQNIFIAGLFYCFFGIAILLYRFIGKKDFNKALKVFLIIDAVVILLCSFFLLPTIIDGYPYTRSSTEGGAWFSSANKLPDQHSRGHSQSFLTSITMLHWSWFITPLKSKEYPPIIFVIIYSLPFLLAVWGLFKTKLARQQDNRSRMILFMALGLISLNLALGTGLHSFGLFNWAYKFIPYFHMARAPYRYFYQGVLSICLLSGLAFYKLPKIKRGILFLVVAVAYLYAANYYGNHYNWTFIPSEEPHYLSQVQDWLKDNNKEGHRIIETFVTPSYLGNNQRMFPNGLDLLLRNIDKDYLDKYLALFGFKYILAPRQHSRRHLTFDSKGYMPPRADDGYQDREDNEEYYSALTTEFFFVYERLRNDPNFALYTADTKDVAIFENKAAFDNYRLYPAKGLMILGGVNAYDFLDLERFGRYLEKDSPLRIAPIFIAQSKNLKKISKIREASGELILHNTDLIDLYFLMNQSRLIFLSALKNPQWNFSGSSAGWAQPVPAQDHSLGNFILGDLSFSDFSIITERQGSVCDIPIKISKKDNYIFLLRIYGGGNLSNLSVYFNDKLLRTLEPKSFRGFRWIQLGEGELQPGSYSLQIKTEEAAAALLDTVAIIPVSEFNAGLEGVYSDFKDISVTYMINNRNILRADTAAATDLLVPESGDYDITLRLSSVASGQIRGKLSLKIDSEKIGSAEYNLPQSKAVNIALNKLWVSKGRHNIIVEDIPQNALLEFISVAKTANNQNKPQEPNVKINYAYDSFSNYRGRVESDKPLILLHSEANYRGWKINAAGTVAQPIITNMFLNGFIVDKTGSIGFDIYYLNNAQMFGIIISLSALILIIFLIFCFRPKVKDEF